MKDTGAVENAGFLFAVFLSDEPTFVFSFVFVFPMATLEAFYILRNVLEIFFVEEMCTERAAAVHQFR